MKESAGRLFGGGLLASGASIEGCGGREKEHAAYGIGIRGHNTPERELWSNYRHPNWQGSQVALLWASGTPNPNWGGAFTGFGEKYAIYASGFNGYFAGMLGVADEGAIADAYQATARLYHEDEGRWVSPDPAGLGKVDLTNPQSWNRYAYVLNNPLDYVDPSGLFAYCEWGTDGNNNCLPDPDPGPPIYCPNCGSSNINVNLPSGGGRGNNAPNNTPSNNPCPAGTTPHTQRMLVTGYDNSYQSTGKNPGDPHYGQTTSGAMAGPGTIAAPRTFSFGTQMFIPGYGLGTVLDRGGAIRNSHIDLWFPSTQQAINWGAQHLQVTVCR